MNRKKKISCRVAESEQHRWQKKAVIKLTLENGWTLELSFNFTVKLSKNKTLKG